MEEMGGHRSQHLPEARDMRWLVVTIALKEGVVGVLVAVPRVQGPRVHTKVVVADSVYREGMQ